MVDYREILRLLSPWYYLTQISESLHSSATLSAMKKKKNHNDYIAVSLNGLAGLRNHFA